MRITSYLAPSAMTLASRQTIQRMHNGVDVCDPRNPIFHLLPFPACEGRTRLSVVRALAQMHSPVAHQYLISDIVWC